MIRRIHIMILTLFVCSTLYSDTVETYTVENILSMVKNCSDDIAIAQIEYVMGKEDVKLYKAEAMPQISLNSHLSLYAQSINGLGFTSSVTSLTPLVGDKDYFSGHRTDWTVSLYQPLITFGKVAAALRISHVRDTMLTETRKLKFDMYYLSVISSFGNVYKSSKELAIAKKNLERQSKLLTMIKKASLNGSASQRDSLRVLAAFMQAKSRLISARANYTANVNRFSQLTETKFHKNAKFEYNEKGWASKFVKPEETTLFDHETMLKELEVKMREDNIAYEKSKLLPSIALFANISNSLDFLSKDLEDKYNEYKTVMNLQDLPSEKDILNYKYFNYIVGLEARWTLFSGRRNLASYRKSKYQHLIAERELKIMREKKDVERQEAISTLKAVSEAYEASKLALDAIRKSFEQTNKEFNNGFVSYSETVEIEKELNEAELMVANIAVQKMLAVAQVKLLSGKSLIEDKN